MKQNLLLISLHLTLWEAKYLMRLQSRLIRKEKLCLNKVIRKILIDLSSV